MLIKSSKKIKFLGFVSALFLASSISAAEDKAPMEKSKKPGRDRFEMISKKLQLTDKQKTELKPILDKLKKNRIETLKKLEEQEHKELSTVLKPEQVTGISRYLKRGQRMGPGKHKGKKKGEGLKRRMEATQKGMQPKPPATLPEK